MGLMSWVGWHGLDELGEMGVGIFAARTINLSFKKEDHYIYV